ncbi:SUMF1/EgtB/PvdO family nonheme iron enzyme [Candidatus Halobeggiatoa sp. HSG11]|nr:SUMF1/EgtB/PvdO family nonheme iron enzyme [Candidatus Halobeggiatoa sp. HSG11]
MTIETHSALETGCQLKEYRILSVIGQGDFGITYLAQDTKQNHQVAIKEYFPNNLATREDDSIQPKSQQDEKNFLWGLDRFSQEGKSLTTLQHPNIVRVLSFFKENNTAYIVMEYEQGQNLEHVLENTLSETEIKAILPPLLSGVHAVHEAGFLHQNIKPSSIYLRDKDNTPVLLNFGTANYAMGRLHREAIVTPGYAPFEQYQTKGPQGPWTDIYALGAILYQATTGKIPPEVLDRINAITRNKSTDPLLPVTDVAKDKYSDNLTQSIEWALQIAEEDRPQTVQQWANNLLPNSTKILKQCENISSDNKTTKSFNHWAIATFVLFGLSSSYVIYTQYDISNLKQQYEEQLNNKNTKLHKNLKATQQTLAETKENINSIKQQLAELQDENYSLQSNIDAQSDDAVVYTSGAIIRDKLSDGSYGPDMVWLPGDKFMMGDIQGNGKNNEQPVHWMTVNSFAMGRYEVTFAQYDRFAEALEREKLDDAGWGRGVRPVINISWYDAYAYAHWLSKQTGHKYRLPTEAEWEYAARAGSISQYWWGDEIMPCSECENKTMPIGSSLPANSFDLYDMNGNVREWTCSEYVENYVGKERVCTNRNSNVPRVERGGSWLNPDKRVSARYHSSPEQRYLNVGFRLVREY